MSWLPRHRRRGRPRHPDVLTPAEWRVLEHLREGRSNPEIAERLGVSVNTVRTQVSAMLAKLGLPDRHALAAWPGEPATLGEPADRRLPSALPLLAWLRAHRLPVAVISRAAGIVAASVLAAIALVAAIEATRDDLTPPGAIPTPAPTGEPTATPEPPRAVVSDIEWTIGEPVPLPDGVTLVLGTGCWQCGGQYSTFELFDANGRSILHDLPDEVHMTGYFDDPEHLYLVGCRGPYNCDVETYRLEGSTTTLYESVDGGVTWNPTETGDTFYRIIGRTSDELLVDYDLPGADEFCLVPSGRLVVRPTGAASDGWPWVIGGEIAWETADHRLLDSMGSVIADFSAVVPTGAEIWTIEHDPDAGFALVWRVNSTSGLTIVRDSEARTYRSRTLEFVEVKWLDEQRLIASIPYPLSALEELGVDNRLAGSRTPTILDLDTATLHPIEEFLIRDPDTPIGRDAGIPIGRNIIEAVWLD